MPLLTTTAERARERARQRQYRQAAADWVRDIIRTDRTGRWYPFILNSIHIPAATDAMPAGHHDKYRRIAIIRACEHATAGRTTRAQGNPTRQHRDDTVRVVYVPAKNGSVHIHLHGWCRVPAIDTTTSRLSWKDDGRDTDPVDAPASLVAFSTHLCDGLATKNIWWNLGDDSALGSVDYAERLLRHEQREWGQVECQPAYAFVQRDAA